MSRRTLTRAPDPHQAPPVPAAVRQHLFGTVGALLLLSATEAGPAKAAELDGELLACCAEADRLEAQADALTAGWPSSGRCPRWAQADRLMDEAYDLRDRAAELPARTPEGLQAKARLVLARLEPDSLAAALAHSLARDVLGRAGQAVPPPATKGHARDPVPHPDAPLLAACAAFDALERAYLALGTGGAEEATVEAERDRLMAAQAPLLARMCELRAVTGEGHAARARSLALWDAELLKDTAGDAGGCLTAAIVRDLIGRAPAPVTEAHDTGDRTRG